jgi:DNA repair exonuclease SbcCD ATPase subunit
MINREGKPNEPGRSGVDQHEEFLELCALSTTGELTLEEQRKLQEHLAVCPNCREATQQFDAVVNEAVPSLAPELAKQTPEEDPAWSTEKAEAAFFERLSEQGVDKTMFHGDRLSFSPVVRHQRHGFYKSFDDFHFWLPLAAAALLCAALGILTYRMGTQAGLDLGRTEQKSAEIRPSPGASDLQTVLRERERAKEQLAQQEKDLRSLRRQAAATTAEIAKLKAAQSEQVVAAQTSEEEKRQLSRERDRLAEQLAAQQVALQASEKKLSTLEQQRSEEVIHEASLEAKVAELSRISKEREGTIDQQQELLSHDRDIRELMGARDLYVAEVYDIGDRGETQKAFGRVFYTKEKSLIFYAYDLDGAPSWKKAHAFQAWGTHGADRAQAFNLGMFYEDNASKKRWVLKFNDRKTLEQIDAVFVTIEPRGGSERPSGKPFLFAYLKMNANHP